MIDSWKAALEHRLQLTNVCHGERGKASGFQLILQVNKYKLVAVNSDVKMHSFTGHGINTHKKEPELFMLFFLGNFFQN